VVSSNWVKVWVTPFPIPLFGVRKWNYLLFDIEEKIHILEALKPFLKAQPNEIM
jgi:hypothetical protein